MSLAELLFGEAGDPGTDRLRLAAAYYEQSYPPSLYYGGAPGDPHITTLVPNTAVVGSAAVTVSVNGTSFASDAEVEIDGIVQATTYVSATKVTISYTPPTEGEFVFTVRNVALTLESNDVVFTGTLTAEDQPQTEAEQKPAEVVPEEAPAEVAPTEVVPEGPVMGVDPPATGGTGPRARKPRNGNGGAH